LQRRDFELVQLNSIRRVVTGHDADGRAIVQTDETVANVASRRPGQAAAVIWTTDTSPADNDHPADTSGRARGTTMPGGTVFRIVEYQPGVTPRMHRSNSIDYAVVMSGEIDMELDDGQEVHLRAGDVMVQRGTVHNWVNRGTVPCVIAFTLIDAKPVTAGATRLDPTG
jgi:mannose-6-phosphate isomerase-like protein (cupin superfamily)